MRSIHFGFMQILILTAITFLITTSCDLNDPKKDNPKPEGYQEDIPWPSLGGNWSMHHGNAQFTGRSKFVGANAGEIEWRIEIPTSENSTNSFLSPIIGSDSTIYFISFYEPIYPGSFIYALDFKGNIKWKKGIGVSQKITAPPILSSDGVIYLADWDKNLYALKVNGEFKWQIKLQASIYGRMNLGLDGTLYGLTSNGGLIAVSKNGNLLFERQIDNFFSRWSSIAFLPDGSAFYIVGKNILALITKDGTLQWKKNLSDLSYSTPIVDSYGNIFVFNLDLQDTSSGIISLDKNGNQRYRFFNPELSVEVDFTMDKLGNLYCGGVNKIFCIDTYGKLKWCKEATIDFRSSSIVSDNNSNVFFVSSEKKLVKMDKNGYTQWEIPLEGNFYESLALSDEGKIFLGAAEKKKYFYCIK